MRTHDTKNGRIHVIVLDNGLINVKEKGREDSLYVSVDEYHEIKEFVDGCLSKR